MKSITVRMVAGLLLLAVFTSCAATTRDPQLTAAKQKVFATRNTYVQGAVIGALVGAAAGAIIGHQRGRAGEGALVGGLVGGAGGLMYADNVVARRRAYAQATARLQASTSYAEAQRRNASNYNSVLSSRTRELRKSDASLRGAIADTEDVIRRLESDLEKSESELATARASGVSLAAQRNQQARINSLKREIRNLEAQVDRLTEMGEQQTLAKRK